MNTLDQNEPQFRKARASVTEVLSHPSSYEPLWGRLDMGRRGECFNVARDVAPMMYSSGVFGEQWLTRLGHKGKLEEKDGI